MAIPQEELDKLDGISGEDSFEQTDEPMIPDAVEKKVSPSPDEDDVADKARIPYSRFEKVHERAIRAEERLKLLEEQKAVEPEQTDPEPDAEWIELYGDSDAAKRAYAAQVRYMDKIREQAEQSILENIDKRQSVKEKELEQNIEYIDEQLGKLQESLGRELSEAEENSILDIQDEFTPKDDKGNYIAPLLDPEKAFEIHNLKYPLHY